MSLLISIIFTIFPALIFFIFCEQFGYTLLRVLKKYLYIKKSSWSWDNMVIRSFMGMLLWAMVVFLIGVLRVLYSELILIIFGSLYICTFLLTKRWQDKPLEKIKTFFTEFKIELIGVIIFLVISSFYWFRPVMEFDGLWYHIPIPQIFLQNHNIDYNGEVLRYSVHPFINFLWNIFPLSLPLETVYQTMIINSIHAFTLGLALLYTTIIAKNTLGFNRLATFVTPVFLGSNAVIFFLLGTGYNDSYGIAFGLTTTLYIFQLSKQKSIQLVEIIVAMMLILLLALLKIFFAIHGFLLLIYLIGVIQHKWKDRDKSVSLQSVLISFFALFCIFFLPWLIRSYYFTGRLLHPVGDPGLELDAYNFAGSISRYNHWSGFIWERFNNVLLSVSIFQYSPFFALGIFSIFLSKVREKYNELWTISFVSFWLLFFTSIVLEIRYLMSSAIVIIFLGIIAFAGFLKKAPIYIQLISLILPLGYVVLSGIAVSNVSRNIYKLYLYPALRNGTTPQQATEKGTSANQEPFYPNEKNSTIFAQPEDIQPGDVVMPVNLSHFAYIDYPIFHFNINAKAFGNARTADQFFEVLKQNNVKYLLIYNKATPSFDCANLKIEQPEACNDPKYSELVVSGKPEFYSWYRVKY
jgi:hypothetical protein